MKAARTATLIAGTLTVALLAGCSSGSDDAGDEPDSQLTFVSYGGDSQLKHIAAWAEPWGEENDVEILQDSPPDTAKLLAQVDSGQVTWDVVQVEPHMAAILCEDGKLEPIDWASLDLDGVDLSGSTEDCSLPALGVGYPISYNTEVFPDDHPTTWAEFFDTEKYPGKRAITKYISAAPIEAALLADGVAPEDLYPLDIDRAFAKLDTIRDDIIWFDTGDQLVDLLSSGEAPLAIGWSGRIETAATQGRPIANEWNEHITGWDQWVIPKGSPRADLAREWLAFHVQNLEGQAEGSQAAFYGPINDKALELIPEDVRSAFPNAHSEVHSVTLDPAYWAKEFDSVNERFTTWVAQ